MIIISSRLKLRDSDSFSEQEYFYEASFSLGGSVSLKEKKSKEIKDMVSSKNILLLVHGYNNDFDDVMRTYNIIERKMKEIGVIYDEIIGYTWPGGDQAYEYYPAKRRSSVAAGRLLDLQGEILSESIDVMSHSMGCRVVLRALSSLSLDKNIIRNHYAVAAAVDNESIEHGEEFYLATQNTKNTWVFHSKNDIVLSTGYRGLEFDTALGLHGPDDRQAIEKFSKNVKVVNCKRYVKGHGEYKKKDQFYKFIKGVINDEHPKSRQFFTIF